MNVCEKSWRKALGSAMPLLFVVCVTPALAEAPAGTRREARYEVRFLKGMIDHHMMAVMAAELCPGRVIHEELQSLCQSISETQSAEIELMQGWLEDWYGITYEPQMTRRGERQLEDLASLSGEDFEIAFLEGMIRHHAAAVKEGEQCLRRAEHEELIALCESIMESQAQEISQMETWLCEWYGICD